MKNKKAYTLLLGLSLLFAFSCNNESNPIVGEWINPYTYKSTGEFKGFNYKKDGSASAINIPSLDLKKWEIKDGKLSITGVEIDEETGERTPYTSTEKIVLLTKDSLKLLAGERPRITFLYVRKHVVLKK